MTFEANISQLGLFFWILCRVFLSLEGKIQDSKFQLRDILTPDQLRLKMTEIMSRNESFASCPAPNFPAMEEDCKVSICHKHADCASRNQSCCFNGCIFTCVDKISPPPVIDWDNEPDAPPLRKEGEAVLRCTTSPRPAPSEPVGCPAGYVCRIEDHGDALDRRYNSGICVPDSTPDEHLGKNDHESDHLKEKTRKQTVYLPGGCVLSEVQYKDMQDFMTKPYVKECICVEGSVECKVTA